jgi:D-hydroxyproline dehydrogenase subunit beta
MGTPQIGIIGAGIIGLSVARNMALQGARVTVFEQSDVGSGTTTTSFGWVNANGKNPDSYYELNVAGMREHVELQAKTESQAEWYVQSGTYEWHVDPTAQELFHQRVERLENLGYWVERVSREQIARILPDVQVDKRATQIAYFPEEGYVHTSIYFARLLSELRELGVEIQRHVEVVDLEETPAGVRLGLSDGRGWNGDFAVSTVGRWSQKIADMVGIQYAMLDPNRADKFACGFLGYTSPAQTQLRSLLITPDMNLRPDGGGRLLLQTFDLDDRADPAQATPPDGLVGREMSRRLTRLFGEAAGTRVQEIRVGQRAQPADGLPSVGFLTPTQHLYMITTHSGITLAPLLGRLVAEEILTGNRSALLQGYEPDRLIGKSLDDFPGFSPESRFPGAQ